MSGVFEELQRRKVYLVAAAYIIAAGFIIQIGSAVLVACRRAVVGRFSGRSPKA